MNKHFKEMLISSSVAIFVIIMYCIVHVVVQYNVNNNDSINAETIAKAIHSNKVKQELRKLDSLDSIKEKR
jgi:carbon starvation protein CstA